MVRIIANLGKEGFHCLNDNTVHVISRPLGYERVVLPLCKVAERPFYIQGGGM